MISNFMQNLYPPEFQIEGVNQNSDVDNRNNTNLMEANSINIICLIDVPTTSLSNSSTMVVEIFPIKTLNINN
jgi:hypothetical protein